MYLYYIIIHIYIYIYIYVKSLNEKGYNMVHRGSLSHFIFIYKIYVRVCSYQSVDNIIYLGDQGLG